MTYVIGAACIADYSCLEACPVGCIHPTPDEVGFEQAEQLYVDPHTCIDCGACTDACPVDAILPDDGVPSRWQDYIRINREYFEGATHG